MRKARARSATAWPMRPMPRIPSLLPVTCTPISWVGVQPTQLWVRSMVMPSWARRAAPSRQSRVMSAVASVSTSGVFADFDVALGRRTDIDMLVADREGGDHADRGRQTGDRLGVQGIAGGAHDGVAAGRRLDQGGAVIELVLGVQHGVEIGRQPSLDVRRKMPGGEDARFGGGHGRYPPCAALPQAIILVFRGHGYYAWPPGYKA